MSCTTWTPPAVASESAGWREWAWRVVEAQHVASTMKLVDGLAEQGILEELVEASKPEVPVAAAVLHYLVQAPFRYPPPRHGSRFRGPDDPGVFYGAETPRTACAELGYWRWRFVADAKDLRELPPVPHTLFRVEVGGRAIDLRKRPFAEEETVWRDRFDYARTQGFAAVAREAGIEAIVYASVRDPEQGWCVAVLTPNALTLPPKETGGQTWWLTVHPAGVVWYRQGGECHSFAAEGWVGGCEP